MIPNNADICKFTAQLAMPFPAEAIEWRIGQAGMLKDETIWAKGLAYVTNRAIMDRLDEVVGVDGWQNTFVPVQGGMLCGISIKLGGEWVVKWDGAEMPTNSDITKIDPIKTMLSNAEKRAGVPWGIGRYLYKMPVTWLHTKKERDKTWNYAKLKTRGGEQTYYWQTPTIPKQFLPTGGKNE
jgi:hypothetical protein